MCDVKYGMCKKQGKGLFQNPFKKAHENIVDSRALPEDFFLDLYGKKPYAFTQENIMTVTPDTPAMSRIDVRLPLAVREMIESAAAMQGRTRTDFLVEAGLEKAQRVIANQNIVQLTLKDQELLAQALADECVRDTPEVIKNLWEEYAARVTYQRPD